MRLIELSLLAYGAFSNRKLDFSKSGPALHVVYGPNEAGKSTTLRALLALLYGIDVRSPDARLHGGSQLRIAARLLDEDGHELAITRRKANKDTLLDASGKAIDEAQLTRVLGGLSEQQFRNMFGLDHERLRAGGEQLRHGKGDLGESLFQAGIGGGADLHRVLLTLKEEADALFTPRGKRPINEAIKHLEEARKRVREHAVRADLYRAQELDLQTQRQEGVALHARRQALLAEQSRRERVLRMLPLFAKRREIERARGELGEVVSLPIGAAEQRRAAQALQATSALQAAQLTRTIERLQTRRAALTANTSLAELDPEAVRALRKRLGSHQKAAEDLPQRRAELRLKQREASAVLRSLGDPVALEQVETLRLDRPSQVLIAKLAGDYSGLAERAATAAREIEAADEVSIVASHELLALSRAHSKPTIEQFEQWLPTETVVVEFRRRFERSAQQETRLDERTDKLKEREAEVVRALEVMGHEGVPPTEQDLASARATRDSLWQRMSAVIREGRAPARETVTEYEGLLAQSDTLADRMRREQSRVSELARLLAERSAVARESAQLDAQRQEYAEAHAALRSAYTQVWESMSIAPRAPGEMQSLVAKAATLLDAGKRDRAQAERRGREAKKVLSAHRAQWAALMSKLRLPASASVEQAQAVLDESRRLFEIIDATTVLAARIDAMERDATEFASDVTALAAQYLPEANERSLVQLADLLLDGHDKARREAEERTRIDSDLGQAQAELLDLDRQREQADGAIAELLRAARVDAVEGLEQAERRSERATELQRALAEVDDTLLSQGEGASVQTLAQETQDQQPDQLRARLQDLQEEVEGVDEAYKVALHRSIALETGLERYLKSDEAAEAQAEAEQHKSRLQDDVLRYLHRRLAASILEREIGRYRESNQGPLMSSASEMFARLTLGRYPSLRVGYAAGDDPVLVCASREGREVSVEELSDGTRDQLYLALRLATLTRFCEHNAPLPLVLDDVLIQFDDDRVRAAFGVLGELCATTQVIFFTHHHRDVLLAREAVLPERLVEHRLDDSALITPAQPQPHSAESV